MAIRCFRQECNSTLRRYTTMPHQRGAAAFPPCQKISAVDFSAYRDVGPLAARLLFTWRAEMRKSTTSRSASQTSPPRKTANYRLDHGVFLHIDGHFHIMKPSGYATTVKNRPANRQLAQRLHVAGHRLRCEQLGMHDGHQRHGVVNVDALQPKLLAIAAVNRRQ